MPNKNNKTIPMPTFNDVLDVKLRTWNRCTTLFNIKGNFGEDKAKEYSNKFNDVVKKQMLAMYTYITARGYDEVKREVNRTVTLGSIH
jgi:hypothetical protein